MLQIYRAKGERLQHPYGVLPQRPGPQGPDSSHLLLRSLTEFAKIALDKEYVK